MHWDTLKLNGLIKIIVYYIVIMKIDDIYFSSFSHDHVEIISVNSELLFFKQRDSPYFPTLRLLHQCEFFQYIPYFLFSSFCFKFSSPFNILFPWLPQYLFLTFSVLYIIYMLPCQSIDHIIYYSYACY